MPREITKLESLKIALQTEELLNRQAKSYYETCQRNLESVQEEIRLEEERLKNEKEKK